MKRLVPRILLMLLCTSLWQTPVTAAHADERPLMINGTIVAAGGVVPDGWIVIQNGRIQSISVSAPAIPGAHILKTHDLVFPGFVDLHNHPLYAVFPRWKPPKVYANRYEWRAEQGYLDSIQTPEGKLVATHFCDMDAYVELKALAGGTTSILGIYEPADTPTVPPCVAGLVRNLDWASGFYGNTVGQERLGNVLGVRPGDLKLSAAVIEQYRHGALDLIAVHLAEGQRTDTASQGEFARLTELKLLSAKTAVIHGVALTEQDFGKLHRAGASFVWSPRSNFELYGQTADIAAAVRQNVTMALAPDWLPTGSTNMLAEITYAKAVSDRDFGKLLSAQKLFEMATILPARIAKIDDKVGSLAPGLFADIFLLRGDSANVFETLASAGPQDVTLTIVNGTPVFGAPGHLTSLGASAVEPIAMCGEERAINRSALTNGPFADLTARLSAALSAEKIHLAGLAECR